MTVWYLSIRKASHWTKLWHTPNLFVHLRSTTYENSLICRLEIKTVSKIHFCNFKSFTQDRRKVYGILRRAGIALPRFAILDRDSPDPSRKFVVSQNSLQRNLVIFCNNLFRTLVDRIRGSCRSKRSCLQQTIRGKTRFSGRPQYLHLLSNVCWWWISASIPQS